ncbi:CRISPR-associated helicase Cas3' [Thermovibrio ammonificans]
MFLAKKFPDGTEQTISEHTEELIERLKSLRKLYGKKIGADEEFWEALLLAAAFHDIGKASSQFQLKIKEGKRVGKPGEIPHNYLSAALFAGKLTKNRLKEAVFYSVAFHHHRPFNFRPEEFKEALLKDLKKKEEKLKAILSELLEKGGRKEPPPLRVPKEREIEVIFTKLDSYRKRRRNFRELMKRFRGREAQVILLKGLLHRLDHSASAGIPVEIEPHTDRIERLERYLKKRSKARGVEFKGFKPFQLEGRKLKEESVILEAPTGSGKTEFALNWLSDDKGFYTLPVKTAVNAMFNRLKGAFKTVGLLHGERAAYYLLEGIEEKEELSFSLTQLSLSTHLSFPLTVSTADQLFSSVFKYPGFEKVYATLAYSKTVIDEPQGYTPKTLAAMVKGIEEVSELGGKFCVMSATLYPFVKDRLKRLGFKEVNTEELYRESPEKHRVKLLEEFSLQTLLEAQNNKRSVLIVVNTVKRAVRLYLELKEEGLPVRLLHSRFIQLDRKKLEAQIEKEARKGLPVVWITTQVAEASLDVDFDVLITEIAPLDALVQRMGRVNRRAKAAPPEFTNVFILRENSDKSGRVYSRALVELALEGVERWNGELVGEPTKRELVGELYTRKNLELRAPKFLREFEENLSLLDVGLQADSRSQAQEFFREVTTVPVIPEELFTEKEEEILSLIETLKRRNCPLKERLKAQARLKSFTVNLFPYQFRSFLPLGEGVIVAKGVRYSRELGAITDEHGDTGEFV